jgi:hypothetical protein
VLGIVEWQRDRDEIVLLGDRRVHHPHFRRRDGSKREVRNGATPSIPISMTGLDERMQPRAATVQA